VTAQCTPSLACLSLCVLMGLMAYDAHGAVSAPPPPHLLARVGFDPRLGARLPLDLIFRDAQGETLRLGAALGERPALLVPGYYSCRNLCELVRAGVAQAVTASGLQPGAQFNVVLISIDPRESAPDAAAAQLHDARGHPWAHIARWRYLIGASAATAALSQALGFRYLFDPRTDQYAHVAGLVVVSPQGTITQYLPGVQFSPLTLRLALVSASQGRVGTLIDRLVLLCCNYDSSTGRYSLLVSRVLQIMGILSVVTLGGLIVTLRRAETCGRERP
jgi:protein SCO1